MAYSSGFISHYWERVDQLGPLHPSLGRCWVWTGGLSGGYGIVYVPGVNARRAHQISWELHNLGEVPPRHVIRHRCDNRLCVNPDHLILGSRADNNRDTRERGRAVFVPRGRGRPKLAPQRRGPKPGSTAGRFWPKINKRGPIPKHDPELGPCWLWASTIDARGYGSFFMPGKKRNAAKAKAHRIAYELAKGPIPAGMDVLHRCGVRSCVNPSHLYVGGDRENMRDAVAHGARRSRAGEANPKARLTDDQIREIRSAYASGGITQGVLAARYGVAQAHISRIIRGTGRAHPSSA